MTITLPSGFEQRTFYRLGDSRNDGVAYVDMPKENINIEGNIDRNQPAIEFLNNYLLGFVFAGSALAGNLGFNDPKPDKREFFLEHIAKRIGAIGRYGVSVPREASGLVSAVVEARHFGEFVPLRREGNVLVPEHFTTQIVYGSSDAIAALDKLNRETLAKPPKNGMESLPRELDTTIPEDILEKIIAVACIPYSAVGRGGVSCEYYRTHLLTNPKIANPEHLDLMARAARYIGTIMSNSRQPLRPISEL